MEAFLVVNADDLGVSRGATLGIVEAHRNGIVTSASLAATTPFYGHALEACVRSCPALGLGLHFTLTSGRPVSPVRDVPLLVDESGFLRWRFVPLLAAAGVRERSDLLEQVEIELEAQLDRLTADGVRPDHIDGERHVHLIPGIFEKVAAAAVRRRIPFVRLGSETGTRYLGLRHAAELFLAGGFFKSALLSALTARDRKRLPDGLRSAENFASYLYSGRPDLMLRGLLESPPSRGLTELMVHPGLPEESASLSLGNRELERYLASEDRRRELDLCIEARGWTSGWKLTTFGQFALEAGPRC